MLLRLSPLLAALLLAACQSLPTPPKEPARYDLGAAALVDVTVPAEPAALVLTDIQAPWQAEGSTTAMYYRLAYAQPHNLHTYSQASWSLPPELLVQERLRHWLSQGQRVVLSAEGGRIPPRVAGQQPPVLLLALEEFEQVFDQPEHSVAKVRLRATLLGHRPAGEVLLGQQVFSVTTPAASADAAGGAKALSQALDSLGQQLVAWLRQSAANR
ncbi:ABC-type transport auxiliary lipoprotein family protein [Comamonas nitrativorans]|uniref:ABC-type transport auxiliary lipoprotein family protein n=1 Tax=Comamonas nitrativorans TaxID=108437 RepID=A0ABV9H1U0_9BURK